MADATAGGFAHGDADGAVIPAMEVGMKTILRIFRWLAAMALAGSMGIVPGCATMGGGGGMHYLMTDPSYDVEHASST
jgi:hypothetical protein